MDPTIIYKPPNGPLKTTILHVAKANSRTVAASNVVHGTMAAMAKTTAVVATLS